MALVRIDQLTNTTMNAFIQDTREHGIFNTKFTAINNSTTEQSMGIDLSSSSYDINCAIRKAGSTGDMEWLSTASAIKITLSTGTVTGTIADINVTGAYDLYGYAISNNGTLIFGLSRSPYHKVVPSSYTHTNTASARTLVGSASTAWDQMWISASTTINATNSCVCLGLVGTVTFDATNGRASASTLATGAMPSWDSQPDTNPQPYAATWTGFGTVSAQTSRIWFSCGGKICNFEYTITTGTSTATEARASLPITTTSDYPALSICGFAAMEAQTATFHALIEASKAYITFGVTALGSQAGLVKRNGDTISTSSQVLSVKGSVRVV